MKTRFLSTMFSFVALFLISSSVFAQKTKTDKNPKYTKHNERCILDKIDYKEDRTVFHFKYKGGQYTSVYLYSPEGAHPWFLKDKVTGKEYQLKEVKEVRMNGAIQASKIINDQIHMSPDYNKDKNEYTCEVHFERLPEHLTKVDLIEGHGMEDAYNHFNCFDIKVKPLKDVKVIEEPLDIIAVREVEIIEDIELRPIDVKEVAIIEEVELVEEIEVVEEVVEPKEVKANGLDIEVAVSWTAFPNPTTDVLNVKQSEAQEATLVLYNLSGQELWNGTMQDYTTTINVSKLTAGTYVLAHSANGKTTAQNVIIK